jgi:hypothetical protein
VDYPEEKHHGKHRAGRRNSEVLGVWDERQKESAQGDRGGYAPPRIVFSAPAHRSLTIRDWRDIRTAIGTEVASNNSIESHWLLYAS